MLARFLVAAMCCLPFAAFADGPWVYEFEFGVKVTGARVMSADCHKVIPLEYAPHYATWYAKNGPVEGIFWSCGGSNPIYNHFLGRRCGQPLPRLVMECGWRHFSHAGDGTETHYDAFAVRGRFTWGKR